MRYVKLTKFTKIIFFTVLYLQVVEKTRAFPNFIKHLDYHGKDLILNYNVDKNITFFYAICDRHTQDSNRKCSITLETMNNEGSNHRKTCVMNLSKIKSQKVDYRKYKLMLLGRNDVVFAWKQNEGRKRRVRRYDLSSEPMYYFRELLKVRVIHMSTCEFCEIDVIAEERDGYASNEWLIDNLNIVYGNNGTFDLFFRNLRSCDKNFRCSVSYNPEFHRFNVSSDLNVPIDYHATAEIFPIMSKSSFVKAYMIKSKILNDGFLNLISPDGKLLLGHQYPWSILDSPKRTSNLAISTSQESLGICQQGMSQSTIDCSLFDYKGKAKLGVTISLKSINISTMKMHNIFDGGFLILIGYFNYKSGRVFENFDVLWINKEGNIKETREIKNFNCSVKDSDADLEFFEKKGFIYCYYLACTWPKPGIENLEEYNLQFYSNCYPNLKDFEEVYV